MYLPNAQSIMTAAVGCLGLSSTMTKRMSTFPASHWCHMLTSTTATEVASGKILDFAVEKCIDSDNNQRCSKPFLVTKSTCYDIKWTTEGKLSHTTVEVRDAGSDEIVFYRDTDGEWTPEKGEVSYCCSIWDGINANDVLARLSRFQAKGVEDWQWYCRVYRQDMCLNRWLPLGKGNGSTGLG